MNVVTSRPRSVAAAKTWALDAARAHPGTVAVLLGLAVGGLVVAAAGRHGLAVQTDSITYLRAGEDLGQLAAPASAWDEPLGHLAPGYPVLLAATAILTGFDILYAAQVLAVVGCAALSGLVFLLCRRGGGGTAVALAAGVVAVVGPGVAMAVDISAELSVTVVAVLAFLLVGDATGDAGDAGGTGRRRSVVPAGLVAGGALLLHPLGVAVFVAGLTTLVIEDRRTGRWVRRALAFAVSALALPLLWELRTWFVADSLLPTAYGPGRGAWANLLDLVAAGGRWLEPIVSWRPLVLLLGVATLGGAIALVRWALRSTPPQHQPWVRPLAVFVPVGAVVVLVSATAGPAAPIDPRVVAPLVVSLVALLAPPIERWWRAPSTDAGHRRWATGALLVWAALLALRSVGALGSLALDGGGLVADRWDDSALVAAARWLPPNDELVSDRWDVILVQTGADVRPAHRPCDPDADEVVWSQDVTREELQAELPGFRIAGRLPAPEGVRVWEIDGCTDPQAGVLDGEG